jgi:hypothetical protein
MPGPNLTPRKEEETIHMEEELESPLSGEGAHAELKAFGAGKGLAKHDTAFKRPLILTGQGATRCKVYFSKIAPPSLDYMQEQINHWVDSEQIEIKQVSQVIGIMEGKTPVPNIIVTIWY